MAGPLSVHNAEIKTASVEIRTLTISGKQVTLAVFRQLHEEQPPNDKAIAEAWGTVNYCPTSACKRSARATELYGPWPEHRHLVWQKGTELRRTTVWRRMPSGGEWTGEVVPPGAAVSRMWPVIESLPQLFIAI